ncbi:RHS repeat-associated core domain-containing protein [Pseudomonas lijiangensis]|uniref:RHS repeat-associated core domain-containing protein n=1 Tax=Pseudomonas lijiangensis TaxID=2995658 RepID=UPI001C8A6A12|nr:RHS repeat-associated core domain-containing protein [Pseudomonas lijiangensis]MBX8502805.1 toxin [Pseudomonas lijiangensis]
MNMALHTHTPTLIVIDPRGLAMRSVAFCRSEQDQSADERVNSQTYDLAGRLVSQRDPRLALPNLNTTYSLSNQALLTESVDAGWRLGLLNEAGLPVEGWDSRGSQRQVQYDSMLRPLAITEDGLVTERLGYGEADGFEHNQCNQLIRHDDTAGTRHLPDYGVLGAALIEARHFLLDPVTSDWPFDEVERDALLESNRLETHWAFNALGEPLLQTDAMGNAQSFKQTVAGQLKAVDLKLSNATQTLVSDIQYNAFNQVEQETAGNGVIRRSLYDPQDGRLMEISAGSPALQHLIYAYDPVGNIQQIEDAAQPIRFFANQRVEPISRYRYDTLYQLIEATGRGVNTAASHGPALPGLQPLPPDPNQISNYTQNYDYDSAGNLLQMRHVGAQNFTRTMHVAEDSNRSLPEDETDADFDTGFDPNGNQLQLIRGQTLAWDVRNQLQQITTVTRATEANDYERYIYDGQGQRCRKINSTQTSSRTLNNEVRYLPGLEIRTTAGGEILHVITAQNSRVLHWQAGPPSGIANDQIRYSLSDHLGSNTLELDHQGKLISQESYYPFGGTAWWAARSAVEAKYKTVRYSGKERDASGLYYYGFRYYAPWLQRWINPDPAGNVDGLNLFCFVGNNPIASFDSNGSITVFTNNDQKYFIDEELQDRLKNAQKQSQVQYDFLKNSYYHEFEDTYTISSKLSHKDYKFEDYFENKFLPHKWTFKQLFKHVRAEPVVHADQVIVEQFMRVSSAEGFPNALPSVIKHSLVINQGVIEVARKYASGSPELLNAFLNDTQNGKSTQRILNTLKMVATRVETGLSGSSDWDIYIHVEPQELAAIKTEETAVKKLSRFTITAVEQTAKTSRFTVIPAQPAIEVRRNSRTRKRSA